LLVAHVALIFIMKLLVPSFDLFFLLVGVSLSGVDALLPVLRLRDDEYHCGSIFHSVWTPIIGGLLLLAFDVIYSASFLAGGLLHLVTDSTDIRGRPWLYPLSKKTFGVSVFPYNFRDYLSSPLCLAIEASSVILVTLYVLTFGLDLLSLLWISLLLPLFVVFALHQWSRGPQPT